MHILFLSHYYPPEVNAPASRLFENARVWAELGHRVTVVTNNPNHPHGRLYPGFRNRWWQRGRDEAGIDVIRLWTFLAPNRGRVRRLLNYLTFPLMVFLNLLRLPRADVVVSTSPQFFCGLSGWLLKRQGRPWVLEIRDLWPESIVTVGAMGPGLTTRLLTKVEHAAYRAADAVVTVTDAHRAHVAAARGSDRRVVTITNGVDLARFDPAVGRSQAEALRGRLGLQDKLVAAYVGTHGMAHGLDTVLAAAAQLQREPVAFVFVGDGAERARLERRARDAKLQNVHFLGQLPKAEMPAIWGLTDVSLIPLRRSDTFKSVLPSKMFEAMAMARPILLGVEGEAAALLEKAQAGLAFVPEDAADLAEKLRRLLHAPQLRHELGERGRRYVTANYDRHRLAERYADFLRELPGDAA